MYQHSGRSIPFGICLFLSLLVGHVSAGLAACGACHDEMARHAGPAHEMLACDLCHRGDPSATDLPTAHRGLLAYPGDLANADQTCGRCHADRTASVRHNPMAHGDGMVRTTRLAWGQPWADSLLDKLCAGCHLARPRNPSLPPAANRGGGCLACHWAGPDRGITARVGDERCFGCHARSGRIALNYAGLAEVNGYGNEPVVGTLDDGRPVRRRPADSHHAAGLACIDCHTATGLMGTAGLDIACEDCHRNQADRKTFPQWNADELKFRERIPFPADERTGFLVTGRTGTPLWNVQVSESDLILHGKLDGLPRRIPVWTAESHAGAEDHANLSCSACHSQWAPQCYGCHLRYAPEEEQWDHRLGRMTKGRWIEERWDVESGLPALGVNEQGQIVPVVPGMILSAEHPDWSEQRFRRRFAALSPHTTGKARGCDSCHGSRTALGLGSATGARGPDGLAVDAWVGRDGRGALRQEGSGVRPLSPEQIEKLMKTLE